MSGARILLVEDDDAIAQGLERVLEGQSLGVDRVSAGRAALDAITTDTRLVLLDLGLPDIDGIEVCRRIRRAHHDLAIVIVTARSQEYEVVAGLDAGADDYVVKPFRLSELLARVRAHLRRASAAPATSPREAGEVKVDRTARRAWYAGTELTLTPKEFDLLALLVEEAGRVLTRDRIMREVWDTEWLGSTKTLDTHILTLRNKIGRDAISTLRGVGYRFELR